ncbi:MAG: hypothetical protein FWF50_02245, partial [Defluviitaleaceae bacterium]|nr:hypothetical protein [Defluviitaleaceae bacterium]
ARAELANNYEQKLTEKYVYTSSYDPTLNKDEIDQQFLEFFQTVQNKILNTAGWFGETGFLHEYAGEKLTAYFFIELPPTEPLQLDKENIKKIPAGIWTSQINTDYQINNAQTIFADIFNKNKSNIIIETEIFINKSIYSEPKKELRILTQTGEHNG